MKLFAWIGEDEFGSGVVGLKQAIVPAGCIPLVAIDRAHVDTPDIRRQLQQQADQYGKTIRLAAFELVQEDVVTILPRGTSQTSKMSQT